LPTPKQLTIDHSPFYFCLWGHSKKVLYSGPFDTQLNFDGCQSIRNRSGTCEMVWHFVIRSAWILVVGILSVGCELWLYKRQELNSYWIWNAWSKCIVSAIKRLRSYCICC
jgi:hypothetical protein